MDEKRISDIAVYTIKLIDQTISPEEFEELNSIISSNAQAARYYNQLMLAVSDFQESAKEIILEETGAETVLNEEFWQLLSVDEKTAPAVEIEKPVPERVPVKMLKIERQPKIVRKSPLYTAVLSIAAMLLMVLIVQLKPVLPTVASLTDSINAEWSDVKNTPMNGDVLRQGRWNLTKGLAEITFDDGAVVVIEAPAVFDLESPKSMYLDSGKINAFVSRYAIGFTVNTPSASIVDLGTEFGVDVQFDGTCDMQMFSGKANLVIGQEGQEKTSQLVNVKEARNVDGRTGHVRNIAMQKKRFVRRIDSVTGLIWKGQDLSLVDMVGGGNGFGTGKQNQLIDMFDGVLSGPGHNQFYSGYSERKGPYGITPVAHPFIDCVFVPDAERNRQVSTLGHAFLECPDTLGSFQENIFVGPESPEMGIRKHLLYLNNVQWGAHGRPALSVHTNAGITFDLSMIRRANPDMKITAFKSLYGISDNATWGNSRKTVADMWVLVDGEIRDKAIGHHPQSKPKTINVELKDEDHFLTLVTTDSDGVTNEDWCLFANPVLVTE